MGKIYGYCRVSTTKQRIERQIANIKAAYPEAEIRQEKYTGTKLQGRKVFDRLLKEVHTGDTIVFDSVSRMSRNADSGVTMYELLYEQGVNLVFLKEPYINTVVYQKMLVHQIPMTGTDVDLILEGINKYLVKLAKQQVRIAFEQAQKEVDDLHKRTSEGMQRAKERGAQIGAVAGKKLTTKKSIKAKEIIKKHNKGFGGSLTNEETWELAGITKMTFYKYRKELLEEQELTQFSDNSPEVIDADACNTTRLAKDADSLFLYSPKALSRSPSVHTP